jgi:hypothetical protein
VAAESQQLSRLAFIAMGTLQCLADEFLFDHFQIYSVRRKLESALL